MKHTLARRSLGGAIAVAAAAMLTVPAAAVAAASADTAGPALDWNGDSLQQVYAPADGYYSYAPSVVREGGTEWVWSCHNDEFRVIEDHIYLTKLIDGVVTETRSVLQASPAPAWDSFHTCDPSVVQGRFSYGGIAYGYAMFYLGNDVDASAHNQIGVAFATDPEGPWVKLPEPIVGFDRVDQWGVGQPTAVSLSGESGKVLLAYTRGDTSTRAYASIVDLKHADRPRVEPPVELPIAGLTGADGAPDYLNGFDLALDRTGQRVYAVREQHPYPIDNPWWIGPSVQVASIGLRDLRAGRGEWAVAGDIDAALTGFTRNHNAGFVRDWRGRLVDRGALEVVFTSSCSSLPTVDDQDWSLATCDSLYSYDLWSITGELGE